MRNTFALATDRRAHARFNAPTQPSAAQRSRSDLPTWPYSPRSLSANIRSNHTPSNFITPSGL
eukprot:6176717-Pleurochrysis_carterae.AAC.2